MNDELAGEALFYHEFPRAGKLDVVSTKPLDNQKDLSLAYSPGVAEVSKLIHEDPTQSYRFTNRGNLIAVITNGTAVLGLGAIGPDAAKPVMEGKSALFRQFAGISAYDLEINETDPDRFVEIVAALEPTFGGINLEDIKAPECFEIEAKLQARLKIPVFHDDQHGTSVVVGAALKNALELTNKKIDKIKLVVSGAGAAALSCLDLLVHLGVKKQNIFVSDIDGVVYKGRTKNMDERKAVYAQDTTARTLADIIDKADMFLGLSGPKVLKAEMIQKMAKNPIIFALANPTPEMMPNDIKAVRPDAIIATGRSDYPNQANNLLCFPFIFRGALDVGATSINMAMKIACVDALAALAKAEMSDIAAKAYGGHIPTFGRDYLIPTPFDPRLIIHLAPAVAKAAMDSGIATRPITDLEGYKGALSRFIFRSGQTMRSMIATAKQNDPKRVVFAEGEEDRVLHAVQSIVDEKFAHPILIGRPAVIQDKIKKLGLRLKDGKNIQLFDPEKNPNYDHYWQLYMDRMGRQGISIDAAKFRARTTPTVVAALMLKNNEADAMICGTAGNYDTHKNHIVGIVGLAPDVKCVAALSVLILPRGTLFLCDTHANSDPDAEAIADAAFLAAEAIRDFGFEPKVALVCASSFGRKDSPSAKKMRAALELIMERHPNFEVDGEMQAGLALNEELRNRVFPDSRLRGAANLLMMPSSDAANISFNILRETTNSVVVGPLLLGTKKPAHILTSAVTARGIFNATAVAVVEAQKQDEQDGR